MRGPRWRRGQRHRGGAETGGHARRDPFAVLGLRASLGLTDDEVRAAWRRIAAATHPDLAGGGDPARYAAAAAAYTELRTRYGRGEALAALGALGRPESQAGREPLAGRAPESVVSKLGWFLARIPGRVARGRPVRLALRVAGTAAVASAALASGAAQGAGPAVATGAATWLFLTVRQDLAP